jgi:hypothetical protein
MNDTQIIEITKLTDGELAQIQLLLIVLTGYYTN